MKELRDLLKQGESLMREIRETLDKPNPKGVIARPGMRLVTKAGGEEAIVSTEKAYDRFWGTRSVGRHTALDNSVPFVLDGRCDLAVYSYSFERLKTDDGQPIIGYEDDA